MFRPTGKQIEMKFNEAHKYKLWFIRFLNHVETFPIFFLKLNIRHVSTKLIWRGEVIEIIFFKPMQEDFAGDKESL